MRVAPEHGIGEPDTSAVENRDKHTAFGILDTVLVTPFDEPRVGNVAEGWLTINDLIRHLEE